MIKSTIPLLLLLLPIACEQAEAKRAAPQTAAAKPAVTPPASPTPAKTVAPAPTPSPVATKAEPVAPTPSTAPARPTDVPADWQPIVGDVWSFWVPADWKVSPWAPSEGASHPDDRQAAAQRNEGGMEIATLECTLQSDASPSHASQAKVTERAKADAKDQAAKVAEIEVDHGGTKRKAVEVEYAASGDDTHVLARWVAGTRAFGLVCTDQSGTNAPADLELLKIAVGSLRWS